jgi:hypothetical protein
MAIKYLNTGAGHGITYECDTQDEADGVKGNLYPGQFIKLGGSLLALGNDKRLINIGGESTFSVDGYTFDKVNIATVDGDDGDDATAEVGVGSFKTVGAAAIAAKAVYDANTEVKVCVYVKASMSIYTLSTNGAECFPDIHYYYEPKAITNSNNGFSDFENLRGNYYIHGKGEHYSTPGAFNCTAWGRGSTIFMDADTIHNMNTLQNYPTLPYNRAIITCNADNILTAGNWQGEANDLVGGIIEFNETTFLGGIAINNFWQDKQTHTYNRCKFMMNSPVFNPTDGSYTVYYKDGSVAMIIDMVGGGNGSPRGSRLYDFDGAADLQEVIDVTSTPNVRSATVDIKISTASSGSGRGSRLTFIDCQFYVDADKSLGFKIDQVNDCFSNAFVKLIRPTFIDESGGSDTGGIAAYKASTVTTEIALTIEGEVYSTDSGHVSHTDVGTTKPDITVL